MIGHNQYDSIVYCDERVPSTARRRAARDARRGPSDPRWTRPVWPAFGPRGRAFDQLILPFDPFDPFDQLIRLTRLTVVKAPLPAGPPPGWLLTARW